MNRSVLLPSSSLLPHMPQNRKSFSAAYLQFQQWRGLALKGELFDFLRYFWSWRRWYFCLSQMGLCLPSGRIPHECLPAELAVAELAAKVDHHGCQLHARDVAVLLPALLLAGGQPQHWQAVRAGGLVLLQDPWSAPYSAPACGGSAGRAHAPPTYPSSPPPPAAASASRRCSASGVLTACP
jgi:hypothetical protein